MIWMIWMTFGCGSKMDLALPKCFCFEGNPKISPILIGFSGALDTPPQMPGVKILKNVMFFSSWKNNFAPVFSEVKGKVSSSGYLVKIPN